MSFKRIKVIVLPTKEKSNLVFNKRLNKIEYSCYIPSHLGWEYCNIYFVSDEEIKEGDWFYNGYGVFQCITIEDIKGRDYLKKIIATTDKSLTLVELKEDNEEGIFGGYYYIENNSAVYITKDEFISKFKYTQPHQGYVKHFIWEYNKGNIITDVLVEFEEAEKTFERSSGFSGYRCNVCGKWSYTEAGSKQCHCSVLKVNPEDNTINIKSVKDNWNREELIELCSMSWFSSKINKLNFDEWVKENL